MSVSDKLAAAKACLILDQPFFATLVLGMPMLEEKGIPTMATDGDKIYYSPDFVESLSSKELVFVLAHEAMHCVFQHMHRRGTRDKNKFNIAADYVINDILIKDSVGKAPGGVLYDSALVVKGKGTTEGVYDLLPDSMKLKAPGQPGGAMDDCRDAAQDQATMAQKEAEMRVRVVQAANAARMAGKLSANVERHVKEFTKSRVDWRSVLRRFISEKAKTDWTYAKPKRRFLADDIFLPGLTGERLGEIVVAVDCSGSISPRILDMFAGELKAILDDTMPTLTHVVYFDTKVLRHSQFTPEDTLQLKAVGGGGTAFSPVFRYVQEKGIQPIACIFLTDLECSDFGPAPEYPVLWASYSQDKAPFGEVLNIKE